MARPPNRAGDRGGTESSPPFRCNVLRGVACSVSCRSETDLAVAGAWLGPQIPRHIMPSTDGPAPYFSRSMGVMET